MPNPLDEIFERFDRHGNDDYGSDRVRQLEHALQCAALAESEGAGATLTTAALLHDIGHLIHDLGDAPAARGINDRHEMLGQEWLARLFGAAVTEPVRLHVAAKRYLTATDPGYFATLSAGSVRDLRLMLSIGIGLFVVAMYLTAGLTNQTGFAELFVPQVLRGIAMMMCIIPANLIALGSVPQDKLKNSAGLYNLSRDLGGAIALAAIGTLLNQRLHFHWNRLIESINPAHPAVQHFLDKQANRLDALVPGDAGRAALKLLANLVQREALVLTYNDAIMLLGGLFIAALTLMPLVKSPRATLTAGSH